MQERSFTRSITRRSYYDYYRNLINRSNVIKRRVQHKKTENEAKLLRILFLKQRNVELIFCSKPLSINADYKEKHRRRQFWFYCGQIIMENGHKLSNYASCISFGLGFKPQALPDVNRCHYLDGHWLVPSRDSRPLDTALLIHFLCLWGL